VRLICSGKKLILKVLALLRIRAHTLSSPPDLVAVIGDENAGRAPANPQGMVQHMPERRRFTQTTSLEDALQRKQRSYASKLKAPHRGVERDVLLRKARRAETASTYDRVAGLDAKHQDKF
jgi:hypothetical protein